MGTHVFRWESPANEVYVTGTFDNWSKSVNLAKDSGIFSQQVHVPSAAEDIFYKFVVDGKWTVDSTQPTAKDHEGNENNILRKDDIQPTTGAARSHASAYPTPSPASAIRSGVGPHATSAALAGAVPLEKNKNAEHMPGEFPAESPAVESLGGSRYISAMDFFSAGDIVPDFSTYKSATSTDPVSSRQQGGSNSVGEKAAAIGAGVAGVATATGAAAVEGAKNAGDKVKETVGAESLSSGREDQMLGVNPLPATSGIGNPIHAKPGEQLPPSQHYTANTLTSNVKLDKDSYEKSDAYPTSSTGDIAGPTNATMVPESGGLPVGNKSVSDGPADIDTIRSAAGSNTTTAQLAGQQPNQPRDVPEVVRESQQEAHASPEAAANPTATAEKTAMEQELRQKVPEEQPTSENSALKTAVAGAAGAGAAAATGAAAYAANIPSGISNAVSNFRGGNADEQAAPSVPNVVKESEKAAHVSPEAAANPEAVTEKSAVERELQSKIAPTNVTGPPAPVASASQIATAPHPQHGVEGGAGKDRGKDTEDAGLLGGMATGVTGAAAAVGGAAYAATQSAKDTVQQATGTKLSQNIKTTMTTSSESVFARDPFTAQDEYSTDPGPSPPMTASATSGGAKDAIKGRLVKSSAPVSDNPTIADDNTAAAIAAATGTGTVGGTETPPQTLKDGPVAPAGESHTDSHVGAGTAAAVGAGSVAAGGITASSATKSDKPALNASKETPAQSVATEAKQIASEPDDKTVAGGTKSADEAHGGTLPGTQMLPTSSKNKPKADSRDVSPMTRPEVTTGTAAATVEAKSEGTGKGHARGASSATGATAGSAEGGATPDKKAKRRSFFGRIKDKIRHHE